MTVSIMLECCYAVSFMSTVADVERHSAECLHAECHYYECHYGVSWRLCLTNKKSMVFPIASKLKKNAKTALKFSPNRHCIETIYYLQCYKKSWLMLWQN